MRKIEMLCPHFGQISKQLFFVFLASITEANKHSYPSLNRLSLFCKEARFHKPCSPTCHNPAGKHSSPKSQAEESTDLVG